MIYLIETSGVLLRKFSFKLNKNRVMKKGTIYDIIIIVLLAVILVLVNEFDTNKELFRFRYIGFLILYFVGRYISKILYKNGK